MLVGIEQTAQAGVLPHHRPPRTVAVVGGGVSGALFGLKFSLAQPQARVIVIDPARRPGRGLAYGACGPQHLLNVPVSRMELGLTQSFASWLAERAEQVTDALAEAGGDLTAAFVQRGLFGAYVEQQVGAALVTTPGAGLVAMRGEVVGVLESPRRGVRLSDGRTVDADAVVLATGNMSPRPPGGPDSWFYDRPEFTPDPWAPGALAGLEPDSPVLLLGAGLTMVDIALRLADSGHTGPMLAVSRRGLLPKAHLAGGAWPPFDARDVAASPLDLCRKMREQTKRAAALGIPWQRVFDAMRPSVPAIWDRWTDSERRQFLRHLRPRWDIHRHRMAPRIAEALQVLTDAGRLEVRAARIAGYRCADNGVAVSLSLRGGETRIFRAGQVINCTGPRSDFDRLAIPVHANILARGLAVPDALGLGLETDDCALVDSAGRVSSWLYALGPLTRPAWWEITAVPEIVVQIDALVQHLSGTVAEPRRVVKRVAAAFFDLGAGI
jgi:uncharacterized NAD(P)/FAD-binding protein YdhS